MKKDLTFVLDFPNKITAPLGVFLHKVIACENANNNGARNSDIEFQVFNYIAYVN
ncbi:MAG: hypothetical protein RMJ87_07955 [Cytophagales bacterium]|nr:hypothetical protein [Bernardetiaceae bacterium]MDW8204945.1 hypothetical protein [Cytophagales bacterium]